MATNNVGNQTSPVSKAGELDPMRYDGWGVALLGQVVRGRLDCSVRLYWAREVITR